jgi:O-antigen/teichoic acid export membrane protein
LGDLSACSIFGLGRRKAGVLRRWRTTREGRAAITAIAATAAKVVNVGALLVTVPLTLNYLGVERYGLWMTLNSAAFLITFSDFGVGNALVTAIAEANGRDDRNAMRAAATNAVLIFSALAAIIVATSGLVYLLAPWRQVFGALSPIAQQEVGPSIGVLIGCFAISLPLNVTSRIQMGLQEGYRTNLWALAGSVVGFIGILAAILLDGGLPWLVFAYTGSQPVAAALNAGTFFLKDGVDFRPKWAAASARMMGRFLSTGSAFLAMQLIVAVNVASDNLIIAWALGPQAVTQFSVPERVFGLVPMLVNLGLQPLWPAYAEARARGDVAWQRRTFLLSLWSVIGLSTILLGVLAFNGTAIFLTWTDGAVVPSIALIIGLTIWKLEDCLEHPQGILLTSQDMIRTQVLFTGVGTAASLSAKILLLPKLGFVALPYISAGIRGLVVAAPLLFLALIRLDGLSKDRFPGLTSLRSPPQK